MNDALRKELEAAGAFVRPAAKPIAPDPVLTEIRQERQAAELRAAAALDSLRQIRDLLAQKREMKFELVRDDNGDLEYVVARPL